MSIMLPEQPAPKRPAPERPASGADRITRVHRSSNDNLCADHPCRILGGLTGLFPEVPCDRLLAATTSLSSSSDPDRSWTLAMLSALDDASPP